MEDNAQEPLNNSAELLRTLAEEHQLPVEIAQQMALLMQKYPDLSLWGSKKELTDNLEKVVESAFMNNLVEME